VRFELKTGALNRSATLPQENVIILVFFVLYRGLVFILIFLGLFDIFVVFVAQCNHGCFIVALNVVCC
jgi:hypothetical protein